MYKSFIPSCPRTEIITFKLLNYVPVTANVRTARDCHLQSPSSQRDVQPTLINTSDSLGRISEQCSLKQWYRRRTPLQQELNASVVFTGV
jgi:hypothetical protein